MDKLLISALKKNVHEVPPLWLMRQAGRYLKEYRETRERAGSFLDLCYTPELASEVTLQPIRRFNFDASIIFSDILVIPHALGMQLDYVNGEGPKLGKLTDEKAVHALKTEGAVERLYPVMEALKKVKEGLPESTTLIGFSGAPWTVAAYMLEGGGSKDFAEARGFAYHHPHAFKNLLDTLVEVTSKYLIAQVDAGAECLQIFDSWAGMVPENRFEDWVINPTAAIIRNVKKIHPDIPVIGFPKGANLQLEAFVKATKVEGISIDTTVPATWAAEKLQPHACVQGNLDPALLTGGTKEAIAQEVRRIKNALGGGGFIFNLGHGILPQTPVENVEHLLRCVREA